jgi:hypothetical protein
VYPIWESAGIDRGEPQEIEPNGALSHSDSRRAPNRRKATVACNDEGSAQDYFFTVAQLRSDAANGIRNAQQLARGTAHDEAEIRMLPRFGSKQFEKLLLRNDDDAVASSRVEDSGQFEACGRMAVPDIESWGENVAQPEDSLAQVQIAEYPRGARLKQFAAKLARERSGLLQNRHAYAASAQ